MATLERQQTRAVDQPEAPVDEYPNDWKLILPDDGDASVLGDRPFATVNCSDYISRLRQDFAELAEREDSPKA